MKKPKLTLVGAGPGDPELLTIKAVRVLREADAVLYDALANPEILDHCRPDCIKVFAGKRSGKESAKQEWIQEQIVTLGLQYGHVVRLKGGDPFVFARGHEELDFAHLHGFETDVVPGISSTIALPELERIPLTARGVTESFWVTTATLRDGSFSRDIELAAASSATMIVLMGLHKAPQIVALFTRLGRQHTPFAIVENGSLPGKRVITGMVEEMETLIHLHQVVSPALMIIGDVVSLRSDSHGNP